MKKVVKLLMIISILYFITINFIKMFNVEKDNRIVYNSDDVNITKSSEKNNKIIKEYISDGMNTNVFKTVINKKEKYVDKKEDYKKINYNFEKNYKYEELETVYKKLNNSKIVKLEIIGESVDNRNIYSLEIGTGNNVIMLEGNIHAAEIAPALFLTKFAVDLVNNYEDKDPYAVTLLKEHKIVIVPTVNPDGYNYSLYGKKTINNKESYVYNKDNLIEQDYYKANINGVDLNRNFPTQLGGLVLSGKSLSSTTSRVKSPYKYEYYPGESLGSEPETQSLIYWMYKHYKNAYAYLAVHSAGRVIYNGKPSLSDKFNDLSHKCATIINKYTDYEILGKEYEDDGYGTDGTSTDMIAELVHNFKFSEKTGRLSTDNYNNKSVKLDSEICVATIETMENYTQDISKIKKEYYDKKFYKMFTAIAELN